MTAVGCVDNRPNNEVGREHDRQPGDDKAAHEGGHVVLDSCEPVRANGSWA
jgi:hypothetical protein